MSMSRTTTDHAAIRAWAEERGGHPALARDPQARHIEGILRIDFHGCSGEVPLEEISWEEFFETFERNGLAFHYQDETPTGGKSRSFKLVYRESAGGRADLPRSWPAVGHLC